MTLSSDTGFAPVAFPHLGGGSGTARVAELARVQGHAAGYTAGLRAAEAEAAVRRQEAEAEQRAELARRRTAADGAVAALEAAARALNARVLPLLEQAEEMMAAAALELAEAVLGHELSDGETSAGSALARALNPDTPDTVHTVRMNPQDLALLERGGLLTAAVAFTADPSLDRGDAVAEFPEGFIDARITSALERVRHVLFPVSGGTA